MADSSTENLGSANFEPEYRVSRNSVAVSRFHEIISPIEQETRSIVSVSSISTVSPIEETSSLPLPLPEAILLEVPQQGYTPPLYRSVSSTGFTALYHEVGSEDEQYRFEKRRPRPRPKRKWLFRPKTSWWATEILSCLVSIVSVLVIIIVLHKYNGKPLSNWEQSITLNSFLGIFATLAQAGLMLPISEGISQLKWTWFAEEERSLVDFETFDEASRGVVGSIKLLKTLKGRSLASLGAILSIMALATSSVTQQILTYPSHIVPSNSPTSIQALAPRSDLYVSSSPPPVGSVGTPDLKIQQSIKSALFNPSNSSVSAVAPSCGSGRCTWPLYSSLAICSKVANVSSFLSITPNPLSQGTLSSNISSTENGAILPNGANLQAGPVRMNISTPLALVNGSGVAIANHSLAFTNESSMVFTAINNYFVIFQNDVENEQGIFGAIEVLTYWCVNNYNTSVVSGVASTNVNATSEKVARIDTNAVILTSQNGKENFTVDAQAGQVLADYMAMTFLGYAAGAGGGTSSDAAAALQRVLFEAPSEASAKGLAADEMQLEGMQNFTQNVVVSLTNAIRALPFRGEAVFGTSYTLEPHIHVSWGWLSFLLFLLTSSFVFFVVTIWKSRRMDIEPLGSSMLATMCVLSEERRSALGDVETRDKMKEKARAVRVRFERNDPRGVGSEEGIREGGEGGSGSSWRLESRGI